MRIIARLGPVLFALALLLFNNSQVAHIATAQGNVYRPQLWLLQASPTQLRTLPNIGVTVYTPLLTVPNQYLAGGDAAALAQVQGAGVQVTVLDPDTSGKVYYFADATADNAAAVVPQNGAVIYQDAQQFLVAVPVADEERFVTEVSGQGIELYELPTTAYVVPPDVLVAAALPTQPDPVIQALVNAVDSTAINDRIADFSGARSTTVGGTTVTIASRYTYSSQIKLAEQYLFESYQRMGYQPQYVPWSYSNASGKLVIADLRGVTHPERLWLIGGHFDATSNNPTVLAPGADDNGSGSAATLVIANLLRNQSFDDTIRFVHFSGEEQGMWGSKVYAAQLQSAGVQVMGYLDLDMIGWDGNNDGVIELHSGTGTASNQLAQMFVTANQLYGQNLIIEVKSTTGNRFSDHSSFWDKGYPAVLAIENFFDDSPRARDRHPYYHNVGDILSRINLPYLHRYTRAALATIATLAGIITGPTRTPTQTFTPSITSTPTATPLPGACLELIVNGGFENADAWALGQSGHPPVYVPLPVHSGSRSLQMGLPSGANALSYSSVRQKISIPASANRVTLTYWERPGGGDGSDYREVLLLNAIGSYYRTLDRAYGAGSNQWQLRTLDLSPFAGQTVYVYFNTYNNGSGSLAWNYVDDVSVQSCAPGALSPTPTFTATQTGTPVPPSTTFTPTMTPTVVPPTSTFTPTVTPSVTPTSTPTLSPTVTPTATSTNTPTPTPTFTPTLALGCVELVTNGGFETNDAWAFGYTSRPPGYVTAPVFAGTRALRLGILPGTSNATSYSSARQNLVLPSNAQTLTLSYQQRPGTGDANDYKETILFDARGRPRTLERVYGAGNNQWGARTFDLMPYRGQTVTLYFNVYNNGAGSLANSHLDEVSVRACQP